MFSDVLYIRNVRITFRYMLACQSVCLFGLFTINCDYYLVACYRRHGFTLKYEKVLGQGKEECKGSAESQKTVRKQVSLGRRLKEQSILIFNAY